MFTFTKITEHTKYFDMDPRSNIKAEAKKLLEENTQENLFMILWNRFLKSNAKSTNHKRKKE